MAAGILNVDEIEDKQFNFTQENAEASCIYSLRTYPMIEINCNDYNELSENVDEIIIKVKKKMQIFTRIFSNQTCCVDVERLPGECLCLSHSYNIQQN